YRMDPETFDALAGRLEKRVENGREVGRQFPAHTGLLKSNHALDFARGAKTCQRRAGLNPSTTWARYRGGRRVLPRAASTTRGSVALCAISFMAAMEPGVPARRSVATAATRSNEFGLLSAASLSAGATV